MKYMMGTKGKILIIIQAVLVYLMSFVAGLICFGAINLVMDINVIKDASILALGASLWTVISAIIIGWVRYRNES